MTVLLLPTHGLGGAQDLPISRSLAILGRIARVTVTTARGAFSDATSSWIDSKEVAPSAARAWPGAGLRSKTLHEC